MPRYLPSDDGKVIDGVTVVFVRPPVARGIEGNGAGAGAKTSSKLPVAARVAAARDQAAVLRAASAAGLPFCERCERARLRRLARQDK